MSEMVKRNFLRAPLTLRVVACALLAFGATALAQNLILKAEDGSVIRTVPISAESSLVFGEDGNFEITCADEECSLGNSGAPEISLLLNPPNPQFPASTLEVVWSIENSFDSCTPTDDAASPTDWELLGPIFSATGARTVTIDTGMINFSLSCTGLAGTGKASILATTGKDIGPAPDNFVIPAGCENVQPDNTVWGRVDVWNGAVIEVDADRFYDIFNELYSCSPGDAANCVWPGVQGTKAQVVVRRNEYAALKFIASSGVADSGSIVFEDGSFGGSAPRIVSIASCPGQFTDLPVGCSQAVLAGRLRWRNTDANFGECELQPGSVYYLNILNAESLTPSIAACPTSACANLIEIGG